MHRRYIRLSLVAVFNISFYYYIFIRELPKIAIGNSIPAANSTNPLVISVYQSLAQTKISVVIWQDFCPHPTVNVKLAGPEIYTFAPFILDDDSLYDNVHVLRVDIPSSLLLGVYNAEVALIQCGELKKTHTPSTDITTFCTIESTSFNHMIRVQRNDTKSIYPSTWAWVSKKDGTIPKQVDYVFTEIDRELNSPMYNNLITLKDANGIDITLSKPTSLSSNSETSLIRYFNQLSNYELVCWMGDQDAERYFRAFMRLYPLLGSQRPFKFKYLRLTDISEPIKHFSETDHNTYNKCKIFFISYGIDQFNADVTYNANLYGQEVKSLLWHISKSHSALYGRSWFLSPRSSTKYPDMTTICTASVQDKTPDRIYAANEELHRIFDDTTQRDFEHIHFMDNSDITEAFWNTPLSEDISNNQHIVESQITFNVAMRCIEKIALTVKDWRFNGQIGNINGLMKNGALIPNDELFKHPYTWKEQ